MALWNGKDPILKERLFGLTNSEGNHGEDVKEYYFYLDSTPTHSYMKYLYKYPQASLSLRRPDPNEQSRSRHDMEYELLDTGVFNDDRYFDVFVEYAKGSAEDILVKIPRPIADRTRPTCTCCRRCGSGTTGRVDCRVESRGRKAALKQSRRRRHLRGRRLASAAGLTSCSRATATYRCSSPKTKPITNGSSGQKNESPHVKDGINDFVVNGRQHAVNPEKKGTKVAAHYQRQRRRGQDGGDSPAALEQRP